MLMKSVNPATLEFIGATNCCTEKDVAKAVENARIAQQAWQSMSVDDRIILLEHVRNELKKNATSIVSTIVREIGKPKIEAEFELLDAMETINYYCAEVKKIQGKDVLLDSGMCPFTSARVDFVPHGVIGLITPWNYPLSLSFWTIAPALLAGNTVVYKPSKNAVLVGRKIGEILQHVLPEGVFHVLVGDSRTGKTLVRSGVDKIFFTGSVSAGEWIMKNCGITPLALELGGKDAAIVCTDANLDFAVQGIVWGAFTNGGQCCAASEQVFVEEEIYSRFVEKAVNFTKSLRVGKEISPLISEEQLNKVESLVNNAKKKGAKILVGGKRINKNGFWFEPTIVTNVTPNMRVCAEEIFGPVMIVNKVKSAGDAVEVVNKGCFGLGASVWSKNISAARKIAAKLNVGMVWLNEVNLPLPGGDYWGGVKCSGLRNTESKLMQCLKSKTMIVYAGKESRTWWYPYS
ncbi:MAG: aldehyde dehydrogenase [Candidatus Aenigmarchaeota archaeon]|nr:aldehyde dehydrogenase [Candidatus Aenigmarchaeota archaeon]